ncbi:hypothetical protein HYC85_027069 [Camellia sinensis]|uniref:Uncharacterized protein n=1 Tax=Camellia sinensis TaxID=4442 RepID=A0A7J7G5D7_CAMSI|nr:hypothetical protein HYC85_027069 [Camellia sinensis]
MLAVSSAFAGAKVESLLLSNTGGSSSSLSRSSQIPVLCKPSRTRRALIQRGGLSICCEIVSEVLVDPNRASVSPCPSLSALEQLKASAADSTVRSNDMFCDDIFGESPAGVRKTKDNFVEGSDGK